MQTVIVGSKLGTRLVEAGLVPKNTTRILIDISADDVVRVHFQTLGGEPLVAVFDEVLEDIAKNQTWRRFELSGL